MNVKDALKKVRSKISSELKENFGIGEAGFGDLGKRLAQVNQAGRRPAALPGIQMARRPEFVLRKPTDRVQDYVQDIARAGPRTAAQVVLGVDPRLRGLDQLRPDNAVERVLLGDKPVDRFKDRVAHNKKTATDLGVNPKLAGVLAVGATLGAVGGDLSPIGGIKKGAGKKLAGEAAEAARKRTAQLGLDDIKYSNRVVKAPLRQRVDDLISKTKTNLVDRYDPIKQVTKGKKLKPSEDPSVLLKRLSGGMGIATAKVDYEYAPILKDAPDLDLLRKYQIIQRSNELAEQGRARPAHKALEELRAKVGDTGMAQLENTTQKLYAYRLARLQELRDAGVLSDESFNRITSANQKYVPFQRVMDELDESGFVGGNKDVNVRASGIKKLKGSDRDIIDPLESDIKNTYDMTKVAEKNKTLRALVNTGEFERIQGSNPLFDPKEPHITLFENGQKVYYKAPKDIADAIKGVDEENLNFAVQAMAVPARWLRAGATGVNVGFAIPNLIRDQLSAAVNSKYGGIPIYDFISGFASVLKQDNAYRQWLLSGADQASFFSQDRTTLQRTLKNVTEPRWVKNAKTVTNPLELLRIVGEYSEKGSRVGTFKRALKGAGKEGLTGVDQQLAAMVQSREATVDFARRGSKMKAYNAMTPFINARLQGSLKLLSSFKERPVRSLTIGGALVSVPAATLYAHNSQYPEYDEIPDYIKDENFIFMTGKPDTPFVKIPKGEIGKIFGNPVESFMDHVRGKDTKSFSQLALQLLGDLSPIQSPMDAVPTGFKLPTELATNYDTFRGQNIVSPFQEDLPPELQFNAKTSETAKAVGNLFKRSPAKLEFAFRGLTGGVGGQLLQATDYAGFGKKPESQDLPILDRFLGEKSDLNKTASKIYEAEEQRKRTVARDNAAIKQRIDRALDSQNPELLLEAQRANPENFKRFLNDALETRSKKDMTPTEKAIMSLPEAQREQYAREQLSSITGAPISLLPTTGQPRAQASNSAEFEELLKSLTSDKSKKSQLTDSRSEFRLAVDRAKRKGDLDAGVEAYESYLGTLEQHLKTLNPETDKSAYISATRELERLTEQIATYQAQGGFTKTGRRKSSDGTSRRRRKVTGPKVRLQSWAKPKIVRRKRVSRIKRSPRRMRVTKAKLASLR